MTRRVGQGPHRHWVAGPAGGPAAPSPGPSTSSGPPSPSRGEGKTGERERQGKDKRPAPAGSGGNVGAAPCGCPSWLPQECPLVAALPGYPRNAPCGCPSWLPQECPLRRSLRQIAETGSKCPKKTESQKYRCRRSQTRLRPPRDQSPGDGESGGPYSRQRPQ